MKYFDHARIGRHEQIARAFDHDGVWAHDAPLIELGIGFRTADASLHERGREHELADVRLGMRHIGVAEGFGHQQRNAEHELALGEILGSALVSRMGREVGRNAGLIEELNISQQEHPFPRHEHVVEEDDAIHLVEPGAERVIEMGAPLIETVATKKPQPLGAAGDGEIEGERIVSFRVKGNTRRIDRDLVGEGAQRGQHACPAYDDAGVRLAYAVQGRSLFEIVEPADVAAALQVDQRMCQNQISLTDVLVVTAHIVGELRAATREIISRSGPRRERDVHEIRRSAHHAAGRTGPTQHHLAATDQVVLRARDDE